MAHVFDDVAGKALETVPGADDLLPNGRREFYFMLEAMLIAWLYRELVLEGQDDWTLMDILSVLFATFMVRRVL